MRSGIMKSWKQRWLVLRGDGKLRVYKSMSESGGREEPLNVVELVHVSIGTGGEEVQSCGKPFAFRLFQHGQSAVHFFAGSDQADRVRVYG